MKTKITQLSFTVLIISLLLAACGSTAALSPAQATVKDVPPATLPQQAPQPQNTTSGAATSLSAYENALEGIYAQVNPGVVSIRVVQSSTVNPANQSSSPFSKIPGLPNLFGSPNQNNNQQAAPQVSEALGSGFIWSQDGYIVTNNHVVEGATKIEVKFADGTTVPATLVGTDPDSDLAVIKVDNPGFTLTPVTIGDSTSVKVGQVAVAIGNPFGLENTMTVGIVSALGRSLPSTQGSANGGTYSIPDIIQTDASINPGNSGGPLVNDQGALIGVNSAIESSVNSNSGVGFAIPAAIVNQVVPALIKNGKYEHSYLGISGLSLTPDLAKAMNLSATQRGALVENVEASSPAGKAGLLGSSQQATIDSQSVNVGGDLITAIDGSPIKTIEDVIAYLADHTNVGQKVTLTILRSGKEQSVDVTLQARPTNAPTTQASNPNPNSNSNSQGRAWLGIAGQPLTADINKEMNLSDSQTGILVEQVQSGSPADKAGLQGSFKPVLINGQRVLVGGDVITAVDGKSVTTFDDLLAFMQTAKPGQQVNLTILRSGKQQTISVTLEAHP
jgi:2-alkenal reductase